MERADLIALPGAVLTCPQCHARVGSLTMPLYQLHTFPANAIKFEPGQEPAHGQAGCRRCGASYAEVNYTKSGQTMVIHTEFGWLPKAPGDAPAPKRAPIRSEALKR